MKHAYLAAVIRDAAITQAAGARSLQLALKHVAVKQAAQDALNRLHGRKKGSLPARPALDRAYGAISSEPVTATARRKRRGEGSRQNRKHVRKAARS